MILIHDVASLSFFVLDSELEATRRRMVEEETSRRMLYAYEPPQYGRKRVAWQ